MVRLSFELVFQNRLPYSDAVCLSNLLKSFSACADINKLSLHKLIYSSKLGGAMRDRTADLLRAKQALSQLSYSPIILGGSFAFCPL